MPVSDKLRKLYADAQERGLYIRELPAEEGAIAFVGSVEKLEAAGFDKEKRKRMDHMQCSLYMVPSGGETREEAVEKAIAMYNNSDRIPTA